MKVLTIETIIFGIENVLKGLASLNVAKNSHSQEVTRSAKVEGLSGVERQTIIGQFFFLYENDRHHGKPYTVEHFEQMAVPQSTVYSVLARFYAGYCAERKIQWQTREINAESRAEATGEGSI